MRIDPEDLRHTRVRPQRRDVPPRPRTSTRTSNIARLSPVRLAQPHRTHAGAHRHDASLSRPACHQPAPGQRRRDRHHHAASLGSSPTMNAAPSEPPTSPGRTSKRSSCGPLHGPDVAAGLLRRTAPSARGSCICGHSSLVPSSGTIPTRRHASRCSSATSRSAPDHSHGSLTTRTPPGSSQLHATCRRVRPACDVHGSCSTGPARL